MNVSFKLLAARHIFTTLRRSSLRISSPHNTAYKEAQRLRVEWGLRLGRSVNQAETPLLYHCPTPPVPTPPPCGAGDTPAPGPAALLLPAARAGGLCMRDRGQQDEASGSWLLLRVLGHLSRGVE